MHCHYVEIVTLIDVRACVRSCVCKCMHARLGWMNVDRKQNWFCFVYFSLSLFKFRRYSLVD